MKKYLDVLFDGRVKEYGAYQLRKTYGKTLMMSTLFGCLFVVLLSMTPFVMKKEDVKVDNIVLTTEYIIKPLEKEVKEVVEPKKVEIKEVKSSYRSNVKFTEIEVTDEEVFDNLKSMDEMWRQKIGYDNSDDSSEYVVGDLTTVVEVKKEVEKVFTFAEEMPKYDGDLYGDLAKNIFYPLKEKELSLECLVYVSFVVDNNGNVVNPEIVRGCEESDNFGKVAINAVNKLGKFSPAKMNGNSVSLRMTIPVKFSLR